MPNFTADMVQHSFNMIKKGSGLFYKVEFYNRFIGIHPFKLYRDLNFALSDLMDIWILPSPCCVTP